MYCPQCQAEYRRGVERCGDCDVPLVAELAPGSTAPTAMQRYLAAPESTRDHWEPHPDLEPAPHELVHAWEEYRRRQTAYRAALLATVVFVVVSAVVQWAMGSNAQVRVAFAILSAIAAVGGSIVAARYRNFPCPRCGRRDAFRTRFLPVPSQQCYWCGLRKWHVPTGGRGV
jgi:hypothetical protein